MKLIPFPKVGTRSVKEWTHEWQILVLMKFRELKES